MSLFKSHSGYQGIHRAREHHRVSAAITAIESMGDFKISVHSPHTGGNFEGKILSLSAEGLFIKCSELVDKDALLRLRFQFGKTSVECIGRVIYLHSRQEGSRTKGLGIRFTRIAPTDQEKIRRQIEAFYQSLGLNTAS